MTILAVGCSFLCDRGPIIPQCEILAQDLNLDIVNKSIPGNGNTHIVYNTISEILSSSNQYSLVLIGWSTSQRWDYVTSPNKWFAIPMADVIENYAKTKIDIDETLFRHWASNVIMMSTWLRNRNIPFIMWNSLRCWKEGDSLIHKEILNIPEFYLPKHCHIDDVRNTKQWVSESDHHPNQDSQIAWAEKILNFYRDVYK